MERSLPRSERLRTLGAIRRLFSEGEAGFVFPFRYVWYAESDTEPNVEVLFSVPKKFHKRANKRNLLRRRTKEAYRLSKHHLLSQLGPRHGDLALIYSSNEIVSYAKIEHSLKRILETIVARL